MDKFIIEKLGGFEAVKRDHRDWLVGKGEHPALDYKMRIMPTGNKTEYIIASRLDRNKPELLRCEGFEVIEESQYFAQESEYQIFEFIDKTNKERGYKFKDSYKKDLKKLSKKGIKHDIIELIINSLDDNIVHNIKTFLPEFFVVENFGTRSGKGFGSYTVKSMIFDNEIITFTSNIDLWLKSNYDFVYKKTCLKDPYSVIQKDYMLLKSGLSKPKYAKSKLMLYGLSLREKQRWEKRFIKKQINNVYPTADESGDKYKLKDEHKRSTMNNEGNDFYLRALLGIAEQYEFLLDNPPQNNKNNKLFVKIKNDEIQRYKSPLLFKIIDNTIYLVGNDINNDILGKSFSCFVTIQGDDEWIDDGFDKEIEIPKIFSLRDFMSFAMSNNDNDFKLKYTNIK
ncbi:hypothetical protein FACS189414_1090 [Bacteroidia bacterium]|nr:hypothetical protein FACS189414_1090 [Bacteroidia bacterium]